jgi:hypothetical protein
MTYGWWRAAGAGLLLLTLMAGPARPQDKAAKAPGEDAAAKVRARFSELQAALKAKDVDRTWKLLAAKSQADAERVAKAVRSAYAKASRAEKAAQEEALGLSGKELAGLTAKDCLRTKRFRKKADEIARGEFRKVAVESPTSARVYFFDAADDETERVVFVHEGGEWKAWLPVLNPLKAL